MFEFDMDWVWIILSVIVSITGAVILSRQKSAARAAAFTVPPQKVPSEPPPEPEIPTLTDVVVAPKKSVVEPIPVITTPTADILPETPKDARWRTAPSQWAMFTFMAFNEVGPVSKEYNLPAVKVAAIYNLYNKKLQLPGLYDAEHNAYAFQRLEVKDKTVYEPDVNGAADRYIKEYFPEFVNELKKVL